MLKIARTGSLQRVVLTAQGLKEELGRTSRDLLSSCLSSPTSRSRIWTWHSSDRRSHRELSLTYPSTLFSEESMSLVRVAPIDSSSLTFPPSCNPCTKLALLSTNPVCWGYCALALITNLGLILVRASMCCRPRAPRLRTSHSLSTWASLWVSACGRALT